MDSGINVGIIGLGNVPSGLIQGLEYYKKQPSRKINSIVDKSEYNLDDIKVGCVFDIDRRKVGEKLEKAVFAEPNLVRWMKLPKSNIIVKQGPRFDYIGKYVKNTIECVKEKSTAILEKEIVKEIELTNTNILINCLPVGSKKVTEFWAKVALKTKCAFINTIPVFIASNKIWERRFLSANVPIIGDDIKGTLGATILHRNIARLIDSRGARLINTYQLNVGGNTDFKNMLERERLLNKKESKTQSVQSQLVRPLDTKNIHIGPSDFIEFLGNTKIAYMYFYGTMWADLPYKIDLKLEVNDKANAAGILADAIRLAKISLDRNMGGCINEPSAYLMKHPPIQLSDEEAKQALINFITNK